MFEYVWLIPLLPAIAVLINGLFGRKIETISKSIVHWVACGAVGLSFLITCGIFYEMLQLEPAKRLHEVVCFDWISAGVVKTFVAYQIDPLSMLMCMFVTGVGFLIHVYSIGYMMHDEGRYYRFFVYLNLFMFSMINLVLANNFLLLFLGWEGVGLCSYLLIGFWFSDEANAIAGKKAFVTNRIGDFCFVVGMLLMFCELGKHGIWSLRYSEVFTHVHLLSQGVITAVCLLFFAGCTAKSAQIPLYIWLPDAMAGPTPVSALIHAATMVTSGVYMVARTNIMFSMSPVAMTTVAVIGGLTALLAASIGLAQNDIKKVLAYSTVSQLGYMFLGLGFGAFAAGMFHVLTHAFFKALLFLGAGSVIHAMSGEQDMRFMGGLRKKIPVTFWTMLIGTLAIAGIPGLSGFFSKDEILWQTYSSPQGNKLLWLIAAGAAGMTAFYMFRLVFMTFFNENRASHEVQHHIHESPKTMTVPLMILAFLSITGGYLGVPHVLGGGNHFHTYLEPVMGLGPGKIMQKAGEAISHEEAVVVHGEGHAAMEGHGGEPGQGHGEGAASVHHSAAEEFLLMGISVVIALLGIFLSYLMYMKNRNWPEKLAANFKMLHHAIFNKWFVDELYALTVVQPYHLLSDFFWKFVDVVIIDGIVNGVAKIIGGISAVLRRLQTGLVQNYAVSVILGALVLVIYFYARLKG